MKIISRKNAKGIIALAAAVISAAFMMTSCASNDSSSKSGETANAALSIQEQKVIDSPEWLTKLDAVKDTDQIIVVAVCTKKTKTANGK